MGAANFRWRKSSFRNWFSSIAQRITRGVYQIIEVSSRWLHYREDISFGALSG